MRAAGGTLEGYRATGSVKRISVPLPGSLIASMLPPCALTTSFAIASPSPDPGEPGPLTKRSKMRGRSSLGIPGPVSRMPKATVSPDRRALAVTVPPDGVYRIAIVTPFDEVLIDATSAAAGRVVSASVNGSHIHAGRVLLRVEHVGQPPDYIPIVVGQP